MRNLLGVFNIRQLTFWRFAPILHHFEPKNYEVGVAVVVSLARLKHHRLDPGEDIGARPGKVGVVQPVDDDRVALDIVVPARHPQQLADRHLFGARHIWRHILPDGIVQTDFALFVPPRHGRGKGLGDTGQRIERILIDRQPQTRLQPTRWSLATTVARHS